MNATPLIWIDGEPAGALSLPDRGLDFGDGLFETLLLWQGVPQFLQFHLDRLAAGLEVLGFPDCLDRAKACLADAAASLAERQWSALRLTITRGAGPRGYAPPENAQPRIVITAAPLAQDRQLIPPAVELGWANLRWSSQPLLAGIKHLNRLEQVLVAREVSAAGCDDLIVEDQHGHLCSVSAGNLFLVEQGRLLTPALETCGIAGTRRRLVLEELAPALGIPAAEAHIDRERLLQADEVFCCNSIRGFQAVAAIPERRWDSHPVCTALHQRYVEAMAC